MKTFVSNVEVLEKRTGDKAVRLAMYLDEHLRDAGAELARLGREKQGLEGRLETLQGKIEAARVKENAARMREKRVQLNSQIQRLETNLECPICTEVAVTPIYQCTEVLQSDFFYTTLH